MYYQIKHTTIYNYNQPVWLKPHLLRLYPRSDSWQQVKSFDLSIEPKPLNRSDFTDLDGNNLIKVWFNQSTEYLKFEMNIEVETCKNNPFDYLLESWALQLPFDYPSSLKSQLKAYLEPYSVNFDPVAMQLAQEIYHQSQGNVLNFLSNLNQCLYTNCEYLIRDTGEPWLPGMTWNYKQGSCRDVTVLFMEVCRCLGIGTRFVSGYEEGDSEQEERHLHAWVEVFLPGGGWRGYDPTHGLVVSDRHVVLAASAIPSYTAPVEGSVTPVKSIFEGVEPLQSQMTTELELYRQ